MSGGAKTKKNGATVSSSPLFSLCLGESPHLQLAMPEKCDEKHRSSSSSSQVSPSPSFHSKTTDDPALYAVCQLCDNKIRSTRQSNLTNHVRRHATRKQYQCTLCSYQHNEISKVRLHLQSNHKDTSSQPIDNLSPELQAQWEALMLQCFPGFQVSAKSDEPKSASKIALLDCLECGEAVKLTCLATHLDDHHKDECIPYACGECDFESGAQWKVRLHIAVEHRDNAAEITVRKLPAGSRAQLFFKKFFPGFDNGNEEKEEQRLLDLFINSPFEKKTEKRADKLATPGRVVLAIKKDKVTKVEETTIRCEICEKMMPQPQRGGLSSLMAHAKRHYALKQWKCAHCEYSSSDAAHVRSHTSLKHNSDEKPKDNGSEEMQRAWLAVMRQAFPSLSHLIDSFKFKSQITGGKPSEEDDDSKASALD